MQYFHHIIFFSRCKGTLLLPCTSITYGFHFIFFVTFHAWPMFNVKKNIKKNHEHLNAYTKDLKEKFRTFTHAFIKKFIMFNIGVPITIVQNLGPKLKPKCPKMECSHD